jgi:hypothetical protein
MSDPVLPSRSLIIFAICLPLAVLLGYLAATPEDNMSFAFVVILAALLLVPLLLRWHHLWLIVAWNAPAVIFFLPGQPGVAMVMCAVSLLLSILQHILNPNQKFIHVPSLFWPLLFLAVVIIVTAELTGGIGLAVTGGGNYGGKRYIQMLVAIIGYFALAAFRIPPRKAAFYVAVFFLSALASVISNLTDFVGPSALYYILLLIPPQDYATAFQNAGDPEYIERLGGVTFAAASVFSAMLALYGIRGIFDIRKIWRLGIFILFSTLALFGGYRSALITLLLTFAFVFWLEGLMRSRLLPVFLFFGVFAVALALPYTEKFPLSVQRTISFIPFVHVSPTAENNASSTTEWRLKMWGELLPEIPGHLLLGKGLSINAVEFEQAEAAAASSADSEERSILAADYHNGPLSVIIPFGIAGAIGFLWLLAAGFKVLHQNYLFGAPGLKNVNTFLLASFIAKIIFFLAVFGSFYSDLMAFTGLFGLSVSLNGGMRRPAPAQKPAAKNLSFARTGAFATRPKAVA